jgi:hypothetical protein
MHDILDLDRYPLDRLDSLQGQALVARCQADLAANGMFNLDGFLKPAALTRATAEVKPVLERASFTHRRAHNIYFRNDLPGLAPDHPALRLCETVNHTICADQIPATVLLRLYEWPPFAAFLAAVMEKPELHTMADPLARVNVMAYRDGEALNWHFDRSEFTTTLLLQAPAGGGDFEYRTGLRSADDPNYDGVARLLEGSDAQIETLRLAPGTLNVFRGKNTAHRVTPVVGAAERIIAVFSLYERPGVLFSEAERIGFYGRAG